MLWLKAWLETRWRIVWALFFGVLFFGIDLAAPRHAQASDPQRLSAALLGMFGFLSFLATITLAGSGIQTASTRPGASEKGMEGSMLFTLSLPVTRARLFAVRTVTGVLETVALVTLFAVAAWQVVQPHTVNAHDALACFTEVLACSFTLYGISACLSAFCDEGWRFRASGLALVVLFVLASADPLPRSIDIFRPLAAASPLITHQIPWEAIVSACVLAVLFLSAGLTIIQQRDY